MKAIIADWIKGIRASVKKTIIKGKTEEDKAKRKQANKEYFEALHKAVKVIPKPVFTELEKQVKEFTQASDGRKPYSGIADFFLKHIKMEVGQKYEKTDKEGNKTEGIAVGITSDKLANRFAKVFCDKAVNDGETNELMTLISAHLVATGQISTRGAGFGKIVYALPVSMAVKTSPSANDLDIVED